MEKKEQESGSSSGQDIDRQTPSENTPHSLPQTGSYIATPLDSSKLAAKTFPAEEKSTAWEQPDLTGTKIGNYELLELIEIGGMGVIYKARHVTVGRLVALKMIRPEFILHPTQTKRFLREV